MSEYVETILTALQGGTEITLATVVDVQNSCERQQGTPAIVGRKLLVHRDGPVEGSVGLSGLDNRVEADCREVMLSGQATDLKGYDLTSEESAMLGLSVGARLRVFIENLQPAPALLIVGAGHIAQPLSRIGKMLGFTVTVLDDRLSFANRQRFPEADQVIAGAIDEELTRFPVTPSTYIILVTRGHAQDEPALRRIIDSKAAYIGMIGSRRRSRAILQRLADDGYPDEAIERIHAPIGLYIGAQTPEEIAVSILAEVTSVRRHGQCHVSSMSAEKSQREERSPNA